MDKPVTTTVKNIPNKIYKRLKKQAETNRRSVNQEIIFLIDKGAK